MHTFSLVVEVQRAVAGPFNGMLRTNGAYRSLIEKSGDPVIVIAGSALTSRAKQYLMILAMWSYMPYARKYANSSKAVFLCRTDQI